MTTRRYYTIFLTPDFDDRTYTVMVAVFPGIVSEGATVEEAIAKARDAIRTHPFSFTHVADEARAAYVTEPLQAFNRPRVPAESDRAPIEIYVLDGASRVVAGIVGRTVWSWLEVGVIWVDGQLRGRGLGRALLKRAEDEARQRGCIAARLSTWDFQAPGFYEKLGYRLSGKLEDDPPGHTVFYFRKDL